MHTMAHVHITLVYSVISNLQLQTWDKGSKYSGYRIWKWASSAVQTDQLIVDACVRVQLQITEDESRGMTQICTARSDEQSERNAHAQN